jgi:hypothetical protein
VCISRLMGVLWGHLFQIWASRKTGKCFQQTSSTRLNHSLHIIPYYVPVAWEPIQGYAIKSQLH